MIKFITQEPEVKTPTFRDVEINQFFVNGEHCLCQKVTKTSFNFVAKMSGVPYADHVRDASETTRILKILPHVKKIEF
jgi:hypothetical protein